MKLGQWMPGRCSHYHRTPSCSEETPNFQKQATKHIARSSNYVELDGAWSCGCLGMENHGNILWKFCQICRANRRPHCLFCNCCNRLQVLLPVHSCRLAVRQHRWLSAGQTRKALAKNLRTLENFRVAKMQEEHWKLTKLCSINLMDTRSAHLALGYSSCMSDLEHTGRLRCLEHASRFHSECGNSTRCPCIPATRRKSFGILAMRMPSPQCSCEVDCLMRVLLGMHDQCLHRGLWRPEQGYSANNGSPEGHRFGESLPSLSTADTLSLSTRSLCRRPSQDTLPCTSPKWQHQFPHNH